MAYETISLKQTFERAEEVEAFLEACCPSEKKAEEVGEDQGGYLEYHH